ncbi:MAG: hypothetical protein H6713_14310 [Myxococcales bacterium]|nr:hypothetical protein [Myxococcales bacterium]MCB9751147.1 hypothetical protein [Myxococcales bacterium]
MSDAPRENPPLVPEGVVLPAAPAADAPQSAPPSSPWGAPASPWGAPQDQPQADLEYLMTPEPERTVGPLDIVKLAVLVLVRKPHVLIVLALASFGVELVGARLGEQLGSLVEHLGGLFDRTPMAAWLGVAVSGMMSWGVSLLFQGPLVGATIEASSDRAPKRLLLEFLRRGLVNLKTVIAVTGLTTLYFLGVLIVAVLALRLVFLVGGFLPGLAGLAFVVAGMVTILFYSIRFALGLSLGIPIVLVEETSAIGALRRSWSLTANNRYAIAFAAIIPIFAFVIGWLLLSVIALEALGLYLVCSAVGMLLYAMALGPATYVVFRDQIEGCRPDQLLERGRGVSRS